MIHVYVYILVYIPSFTVEVYLKWMVMHMCFASFRFRVKNKIRNGKCSKSCSQLEAERFNDLGNPRNILNLSFLNLIFNINPSSFRWFFVHLIDYRESWSILLEFSQSWRLFMKALLNIKQWLSVFQFC